MERIGLVEMMSALRTELAAATAAVQGHPIQFPVGSVQLEVQVGITKEASGQGKLAFWVLELGTSASYARETLQRLTITLQPPVDSQGHPVKIERRIRHQR